MMFRHVFDNVVGMREIEASQKDLLDEIDDVDCPEALSQTIMSVFMRLCSVNRELGV